MNFELSEEENKYIDKLIEFDLAIKKINEKVVKKKKITREDMLEVCETMRNCRREYFKDE